jgi:GGDEF domain-containing protein
VNLALQAPGNLSAPVVCPRISDRDGLAQGALAIAAVVCVLWIAAQSPIEVQLFAAAVAGLLGMWVVRKRATQEPAGNAPEVPNELVAGGHASRLSIVGDAMLRKARTSNRPLSIAVFDFSDLPELQAVFDRRIAASLGPMIAARLQGIAPGKGVVLRTGPTKFAVLLPRFDTVRTHRAVRAALGKACCLEFDIADTEILLVADYSTRVVRRDMGSVAEVYQQLSLGLAKGRQYAERRQLYLKLERESHTRPRRRPAIAESVPAALSHADSATMAALAAG